MDVTLQPGEEDLGTWMLIHRPENGDGHYNGNLKITNRRLLYDGTRDSHFEGLIVEAVLQKWTGDGLLEIEKDAITDIQVSKSLFRKQVTLTLADGSRYAFDRGMLSIDRLVEAIRAR